MKVSAQTRERTLRTAVVPFSSRPTLHSIAQHSELEQDCRNGEKRSEDSVNLMLNEFPLSRSCAKISPIKLKAAILVWTPPPLVVKIKILRACAFVFEAIERKIRNILMLFFF